MSHLLGEHKDWQDAFRASYYPSYTYNSKPVKRRHQGSPKVTVRNVYSAKQEADNLMYLLVRVQKQPN